MKSVLMTLGFIVIATSANAAKLAKYAGSFSNDAGGFLVEGGQWTEVPAECKPYITRSSEERGFAAWDQFKKFKGISQCDNAVITFDLERSSFCQNQNGLEMFYSPKILAIQCQ